MQGNDPSLTSRQGYIGSAVRKMHLLRRPRWANRGLAANLLGIGDPRSTRAHKTFVLVAAVIGLFLTAAFMAPMVSTDNSSGFRASVNYVAHETIMIMSDEQFTGANGVTSGTGTVDDPFVIENWEIDASLFGYGIMISMTSKYYSIRNVHVFGEGSMAIALSEAHNGTIDGAVLDNSDFGIVAVNSNSLNVTNCFITNQTSLGLEVAYGEWARIEGNYMADNEAFAIALFGTSKSSVSMNTCLRTNLSSIMVLESDDVTVSYNNVSDGAGIGLYMETATNSYVRFNDMTMNQMYGMYVNRSSDLQIYHNRFIGNGIQAEEGNSTNISWDAGYPMGGNYWSGYNGTDMYNGQDQDLTGSDGIGDTSHHTVGDGVDRYPWMNEDFTLIPEFGTLLLPVLSVIAAIAIAAATRRRLQ